MPLSIFFQFAIFKLMFIPVTLLEIEKLYEITIRVIPLLTILFTFYFGVIIYVKSIQLNFASYI